MMVHGNVAIKVFCTTGIILGLFQKKIVEFFLPPPPEIDIDLSLPFPQIEISDNSLLPNSNPNALLSTKISTNLSPLPN